MTALTVHPPEAPMPRTIIVRITNNYGQEAIYPANDTADLFTQITGKKTLSRWEIERIRRLGYAVTVQAEEL
jgi:hypothetical protein